MSASRRLSMATNGYRGGIGGGTVYVGFTMEGAVDQAINADLDYYLQGRIGANILDGSVDGRLSANITKSIHEATLCQQP